MTGAPDAFVVGAVDDAARHPGPVLGQLADVGFDALGITSYWEPGLAAPSAEELAILRDTAARGRRARPPDLPRRLPSRLRHDAADATDERAAVLVLRRRDRAGRAGDPRRDRRQRAEPQPLLAPPVRRGRREPRRRLLLSPCSPRSTTPRRPPHPTPASGAARSRRAASTSPTRAATPIRRRPSSATSAPRSARAAARDRSSTASPSTRIRSPRTSLPTGRHPARARSGSPTTSACEGSSATPSGATFRSSTASSASRPRSRRRSARSTRAKSRADRSTSRRRPTYYRRALALAACQDGVAGMLLFHSHDEPFLTGFQSGVYYVDGTRKQSFEPVRDAILAARRAADYPFAGQRPRGMTRSRPGRSPRPSAPPSRRRGRSRRIAPAPPSPGRRA